MKIKDLCEDERPREKLMAKGAATMSNAELLAILLRTGSRKRNALELAQELLSACNGSLTRASSMSIDKICEIEGIGRSKAVSVLAALTLGKRLCAENPYDKTNTICSASDVFRELKGEMYGLVHEEAWVMYLARNNRLICKERLSLGGLSETIIEVRTVVRRALETYACGVIICHNHPSGDPHPGKADIVMTERLKKALETFNINLLDHVVIADSSYYSFCDEQTYYK